MQERQATELSATNAQLWKALAEARTREIELEAKVATLQADLLIVRSRDTTLQTSLDEVKRESVERLAQLETITDNSVISVCVELMQEFKDGKSWEWNPDYWIRLACGKDVVVREEEPVVLVNRDQGPGCTRLG